MSYRLSSFLTCGGQLVSVMGPSQGFKKVSVLTQLWISVMGHSTSANPNASRLWEWSGLDLFLDTCFSKQACPFHGSIEVTGMDRHLLCPSFLIKRNEGPILVCVFSFVILLRYPPSLSPLEMELYQKKQDTCIWKKLLFRLWSLFRELF